MTSFAGIRSIEELNLKGRRVFIRVDFNVPLDKELQVTNDERIRAALPTLKYAVEQGAKVILASHLGRPKGRDPRTSLEPAGARLSELTGWDVLLPDDCLGDAAKKVVQDCREGQVVLLENLRFHAEEEANDEGFARQLSELADVYVNDAFGSSHRAHASVDALPRLMSERGMGFLLKRELESLGRITGLPERPFVVILGGAKVSDKIKVIEELLGRCDALCIGGAMANTLLAARGVNLQASRIEQDWLARGRTLIEQARDKGVALLLPTDVVVGKRLDDTQGEVVKVGAIPAGTMALDVGPETVAAFSAQIAGAKTVLWNGPMGYFENLAFASGTSGLAQALANSSAFSVVGGGDSVAAVMQAGDAVVSKIGHISTGGGASLELLEGRKLPGVEALRA
ncbi:MAG: phosphoglycerate kinase [Polyangiaceae bacterium]|nr:phosphoglycerate kinase [Polyangiaceae bacterium]